MKAIEETLTLRFAFRPSHCFLLMLKSWYIFIAFDQKQSAEAFDNIADMVVEETEPDAAEQPGEPGETEAPPALTAYEKYVAVYEQNHDFVGWISMSLTVTVRFSMRGSLTQSRYRFSHSSPQ